MKEIFKGVAVGRTLLTSSSRRRGLCKKSKGEKKGFLLRIGRKIGPHSETIVPILQTVLPSGDYTGLVCGA